MVFFLAIRNFLLGLLTSLFGGLNRPLELELVSRPEGTCAGPGSYSILVSQILSGSVVKFDTRSGERTTVVPDQGASGRQAWGLWSYNGAIFVAGGGEVFEGGLSELYVYSEANGALLATCLPLSMNNFNTSFINDVTVNGDGTAYVTDSMHDKLMVVDADEAIAGNCVVSEVDLPAVFIPSAPDDFGANGVVAYQNGLLVCDEVDGVVWYIRPSDPTQNKEIITGVVGADGLAVIQNRMLFVTNNIDDQIHVFRLEGEGLEMTATFQTILDSDAYSTAATSAIVAGYIYTTNARFYTTAFVNETNPDLIQDNVIAVDCRPYCLEYLLPIFV